MNITDLPSELFEYYIFKDLFPHCNLINNHIKFTDMTFTKIEKYGTQTLNRDIRIIVTRQLCFYNNKSLLVFYQYCSLLELNKLLYYKCYKYCIKYL